MGWLRRRARRARDDQRGVYGPFIAIITVALLFLGGVAYDGPRLHTARLHTLHEANEAARVAAATIASGGTLEQAKEAAQTRLQKGVSVYGQQVRLLGDLKCVGSRVQVEATRKFNFRWALALLGSRDLTATGAAEAYLVPPSGQPSTLSHLGECPLV